MRVCTIGTGYVGLVTGACFAQIGHEVICVDLDKAKIGRLHNGEVPIYEPGLKNLIDKNRGKGRIEFTSDIAQAIGRDCNFYFIAVGTPTNGHDGAADLSYVFHAVEETAKAIRDHGRQDEVFSVFVVKSTVPVGTSREIMRIAGTFLKEENFTVASNPEFLREGCAIQDFMAPDRIVAGSQSERARTLLEELYRPLTRQGRPLVVTSTVETAELIKYAANAFLATKITFINEMARLCEKLGADVEELALGIGLDKRIGDRFLKVGPGFGGSCFPKDTRALIKTARDLKSPVEIVEAVVRINENRTTQMIDKIRTALDGVGGRKIAILGLAFKANTDDVRESPALQIVRKLREEGAAIRAYDPVANDNAKEMVSGADITFCKSAEEAIAGADAAVIVTEWDEFRDLDWPSLRQTMARPLIIDLRNVFPLSKALALGLDYVSLGRNPVHAGA
jgi:UDPglucose 6-dehydrogenase